MRMYAGGMGEGGGGLPLGCRRGSQELKQDTQRVYVNKRGRHTGKEKKEEAQDVW